MNSLIITVIGMPAPQGSKRGIVNRGSGRVSMVESSKKVAPWREAVKQAAARHPDIFTGPLSVEVTFTLPRPASHYRTGKHAHLLRDAAPVWPHRKPDVDKLLRATLDALTDAGIWTDDALAVEATGRKTYPDVGIDSLDRPGAIIRITPLVAEVAA